MAAHARPLDGVKITILVTDDFGQVELTEPRLATFNTSFVEIIV